MQKKPVLCKYFFWMNKEGSRGANAVGLTTLGAGSAAVSTVLGDRHFVAVQNGANIEGYFVDDAGVASGPIHLTAGSGPSMTAVNGKAVLVYSAVDAITGKRSSFGRIVNEKAQ